VCTACEIRSSSRFRERMIEAAGFVQMKGIGSSFQCAMYASMCSRSATLLGKCATPREPLSSTLAKWGLFVIRVRPTLVYMDISPYNPPETSTVGVEIIPLLGGFIWQRGGIIAQAGILSRKVLCVMAEGIAGSPGSPPASSLSPVPQFLLAKTGRAVGEPKAHSAWGRERRRQGRSGEPS
jgi:hypothetical protein